MAAIEQADLFTLPLLDGGLGLGQVVETADAPEGTAWIALSTRRVTDGTPPASLRLDKIAFLGFVRTDLLVDGTWPVIGFDTLPMTDRIKPWRVARLSDATLAQPLDPAVAEAFVNACHGLLGWDDFPDGLFDGLLVPGRSRPEAAR